MTRPGPATPPSSPGGPVPFTLTAGACAALDFPPIVCLCGPTRFYDEFGRANLRLTLAGQIVLSIGCDTKSDGDLAGAAELGADPAAVKTRLDELHKRKIDLATIAGDAADAETVLQTHLAARFARLLERIGPAGQPGGPVMDCGCGYGDCSACAGYGWACLACGAAYFGTAPGDGLCPGCTHAGSPR